MNLLLFLSALLTGFTGALSGEQRTTAPAVQQSVACALEMVAEATTQLSRTAPQRAGEIRSPFISEAAVRREPVSLAAPRPRDVDSVYEKWLV